VIPPAANANIARHLGLMAAASPHTAALKIPRGRTPSGDIDYLTLTFAELAAEVAAWQARLTAAGLRPGDRTLLMVRQGLPLIAAAFALFSLGAVPVVIDPGMGLENFLACVARSRPTALVGIPLARLLSHLFRPTFSSVKIRIAASSSLTARLTSPGSQLSALNSQLVHSAAADLAAVSVHLRLHRRPQRRVLRTWPLRRPSPPHPRHLRHPARRDRPPAPTHLRPLQPRPRDDHDRARDRPPPPAALDPAAIVQAIRQEKVTNSFGSPTLWQKIGAHCVAEGITLPHVRRVLCAGAPVPASLWTASRTFLSARPTPQPLRRHREPSPRQHQFR